MTKFSCAVVAVVVVVAYVVLRHAVAEWLHETQKTRHVWGGVGVSISTIFPSLSWRRSMGSKIRNENYQLVNSNSKYKNIVLKSDIIIEHFNLQALI